MTVRDITPTLAPLLQELELEQPQVVSATELAAWARQVGVTWPTDVVVRRLRESGWLLDLKTRGVWEFAPAARAGALSSGDPLLEFRATLARDRAGRFVVAAESAAYLLGLSSRRPTREVYAAPSDVRPPKALSGYRLVRWPVPSCIEVRAGLPVWSTTTLLVAMAVSPGSYGDWPNVGEWLPTAVRGLDVDEFAFELKGRPRSVWARAAYLVDLGGRADEAAELLAQAPAGEGPYYLGERGRSSRYDSRYDVVDTTGMEVTSA